MSSDAPKTILLVDDDGATRGAIAKGLAFGGFRVLEAFDEASAMGAIARETPDAILCDLRLAETDGVTLTRKMHAILHAEGRLPPFIAISGHPFARQHALDSGIFREIVSKPVATATLVTALRAHIRRQPTDPSRRAEAKVAMFERMQEILAEMHDIIGKLKDQ